MKVVLLAAGFATRMHPLTRERAKPLLEVGGRAIVDYILRRALALEGVSSGVVVTNARFHAGFERWLAGFEAKVPLSLVCDGVHEEARRLGAVGDLRLGLEAAGGGEDDSYLVVSGDNLIDSDLAPLAAEFRRRGAPLVVVRELAGAVPPRRHGEVELDGDGRVTSFREKPDDPRSPLAATSLYFFPPEVRALVGEYLAAGGNPDAPGHFVEWLVRRRPVYAARFEGRWFDVGSLESLAAARAAFGERYGV